MAAVMVILTVSCGGSASRAEVVLFDNLLAGSPNGDFGVTNSQWVAQAFSTTATDYVLDEVSLRLWNQNGTTGSFEIQVWDALGTSGSPGAQVGSAIYTGQAANLGDSTSLLTIPGLSVALGANTTYYLVARGTTLTEVGSAPFTSPGYLAWNATDVITSNSYDTVNGSSWGGPYAQNLSMKVTAVPEPSTKIMIGTGLAAWAMRRHRRACERRARHGRLLRGESKAPPPEAHGSLVSREPVAEVPLNGLWSRPGQTGGIPSDRLCQAACSG